MQGFNVKVGIVLLVLGVVAFMCLIIGLSVVPVETLKLVDKASIKAFLLGLGIILILVLGAILYLFFLMPSARRLAYLTWRSVATYSAFACGVSVFGLPQIRSLGVENEAGLKVDVSMFDVSTAFWPTLAVCFTGFVASSLVYVGVRVFETKNNVDL